jgi:hypothetical protein
MSRDATVIPFRQAEAIDDPLTEVAPEGARRMLAQVLIAEADAFVARWKGLKLPDGRDRVVRHGHGPQRSIQTGVGPVEVRRAKVRDRGDVVAEEKIRFTSSILPKWARRTKSLDALLPILYLRGVSTRLLAGDRGGLSTHQASAVHKTANVLNKVALSVQVNMKADHRPSLRLCIWDTCRQESQCRGTVSRRRSSIHRGQVEQQTRWQRRS